MTKQAEACEACGELVDEESIAADRWAIEAMTASLKRNPDLAKKLWVALKLAAGETHG